LASYTALFDACVLYPQTLRDVLLSLSGTGLFRARWSAQINAEWTRSLLERRPDLEEKIRRAEARAITSVPDCLITGYEGMIPCLQLPDPDDRHVLAAAIVGRADVIVTLNLTDFPPDLLAPYGIEPQHPDRFILHQLNLDADRAAAAFREMRARHKNPARSAPEFIDHLEAKGLTETAAALRQVEDRI
jgi:predicted nucleic acid-binding protein